MLSTLFLILLSDVLMGIYLNIGYIDFFSERPDAKIWIRTSVRDPKFERSDSG